MHSILGWAHLALRVTWAMVDDLIVVGAREHNLKNVSVRLPRGRWIVFTGPSGSGKSTLAIDTIYAEGQRRYIESLSVYARQFLERLPKPDVESITGLSPAIAIEQRPLGKSPRSTVGTVTEIADYLRLLFARAGVPHCPSCGGRIEAQTVEQMVERIACIHSGQKVQLLAPICRARKGTLKLELERLRRDGFVRVRVDGSLVELGEDIRPEPTRHHDLDVIVDRLVMREGLRQRIADSVELALKHGDGQLLAVVNDDEPFILSERFACPKCGISLPTIEPRLFSFNSPAGACPTCEGLGITHTIDKERVVADAELSLREGALLAWGRRGSVSFASELARAVSTLEVNPNVPWRLLDEHLRRALLHGSHEQSKEGKKSRTYDGILPRLLARLEGKTDEESDDDATSDEGALTDADIARFVSDRVCASCNGTRLRPEALAVRFGDHTIASVTSLSLDRARNALKDIQDCYISSQLQSIAQPLAHAIIERLNFLLDVGLAYLSLDRSTDTLSSGEGQRIRLATQMGSGLSGVLYVLDEPSVGLHPRDNERLLQAQRKLRDLGNTVLVVEHDRDAIVAADYVVDMGPRAGALGGQIVAAGTPTEVAQSKSSITGPWLSGARALPKFLRKQPQHDRALVMRGAHAHNLKKVTLQVPLGLFVCVTGVSGSGKSSLVMDTLWPAVRAITLGATRVAGAYDTIEGVALLDKVISVTQAPIGRTPRSSPASYTGLLGHLREAYASLPESRARGYKAGRFSFNVKGGRCEACRGEGTVRVSMHFLPDAYVTCETCRGTRFNQDTLDIKYRGLSIAEALAFTVDDASDIFSPIPRIKERLDALRKVGLGYLTLGQPATTLSGGEAQRLKIAVELARRATDRTLYILDEPTTGLHFTDIEVLLAALFELRDQGDTILVVEHNLDVIQAADWVIDLGPEGGESGGTIIAEGTPEEVATVTGSHTGRFLRVERQRGQFDFSTEA